MVDAIINGIIAKEAYSDVKFHCEGKLPRKLMIQDVDLSGLLSNGLENAAEACLHSNGDKCVLFKAASYENMIHLRLRIHMTVQDIKHFQKEILKQQRRIVNIMDME